MPYADPEKLRAAKRESARRRWAADPLGAREYGRTQRSRRRAQLRVGPDATSKELELLQRYPERAVNSVRMGLGRRDDLRLAIEASGYGEPWSNPDEEEWSDWDAWLPRHGYRGFKAPFDYDEEEERRWLIYYRLYVTPPMVWESSRPAELRRPTTAGRGGPPPDPPELRWLFRYGYDGEDRARELAANLASESLDVRRLARYLRHHPSLTGEELAWRVRGWLRGERIERATAYAGWATCTCKATRS